MSKTNTKTARNWTKRSRTAQHATRAAIAGRVSRARLTSKEGPSYHGGTAWDAAWVAGGTRVTGRLVRRADGTWNLYRDSLPSGPRVGYDHAGKSLVATTSAAPYARKLSSKAGMAALATLSALTGR